MTFTDLAEAFAQEAKESGRDRLLLTAAVPVGPDTIRGGYDVPKLARLVRAFTNVPNVGLGSTALPISQNILLYFLLYFTLLFIYTQNIFKAINLLTHVLLLLML